MVAMVSPPPAQADAAQLTPPDIELKNAPPSSTPAPRAIASSAPAAPAAGPIVVASTTPSREEIANAYQSAMRGAAPAAASPQAAAPQATTPQDAAPQAAAPVAAAPPSAPTTTRHIDSGELATLMKRANDMLSMGDIPAARLLLERAADAQDASAALLLARTYDPQVLGNADVRNITPEPAKARAWYQKAAQYGSPEAQRRLAQLPN
jgi:TPR repeat protein